MMTLHGRLENDVLLLELKGRFDSKQAEEADQQIEALLEEYPAGQVVLDAAGLEYISSAGLRIVLKYARQIKTLRIVNASEEVYSIFDITGFTDIISVEKAEDIDRIHENDFSGLNDTRSYD